MKIETHMENMAHKAHILEEKIRQAYLHHEESEQIQTLKQQKLMIKDQIQSLLKKVNDLGID